MNNKQEFIKYLTDIDYRKDKEKQKEYYIENKQDFIKYLSDLGCGKSEIRQLAYYFDRVVDSLKKDYSLSDMIENIKSYKWYEKMTDKLGLRYFSEPYIKYYVEIILTWLDVDQSILKYKKTYLSTDDVKPSDMDDFIDE